MRKFMQVLFALLLFSPVICKLSAQDMTAESGDNSISSLVKLVMEAIHEICG